MEQFVTDLHDRDEEKRYRAAESLSELGMLVMPYAAALFAASKDSSERVRDAVAKSVGRLAKASFQLVVKIVRPGSMRVSIPEMFERASTTFFRIEVEIGEIDTPMGYSVVEKHYDEFGALRDMLLQLGAFDIKSITFPGKHWFGCTGAKLAALRQGLEVFLCALTQCVDREIIDTRTCDFDERERNLKQSHRESRLRILNFLKFDHLQSTETPSPVCFAIPGASAPPIADGDQKPIIESCGVASAPKSNAPVVVPVAPSTSKECVAVDGAFCDATVQKQEPTQAQSDSDWESDDQTRAEKKSGILKVFREAGRSAEQLLNEGYKPKMLRDAGFTKKRVKEAIRNLAECDNHKIADKEEAAKWGYTGGHDEAAGHGGEGDGGDGD